MYSSAEMAEKIGLTHGSFMNWYQLHKDQLNPTKKGQMLFWTEEDYQTIMEIRSKQGRT